MKETKINSFLPSLSDDILIDDIVEEFQHHNNVQPAGQKEWRTNPNKCTRHDIDFIGHIEVNSDSLKSKQHNQYQHDQHESRDNISSQLDNVIGPRFKDKNYVNAEIESSADLDSGSTVKEQLEGRVINDNSHANTATSNNNNNKKRLSYSDSRKQIALKVFHDKIQKKDGKVFSCNNNKLLLDGDTKTNTAMMLQLISKVLNNRKQWMNIKRDFRRLMKRVRQHWRTIRKVYMNGDLDNEEDKEKVCTQIDYFHMCITSVTFNY